MSAEVVIVDYGLGNIASLRNALLAAGARPRISGDPGVLRAAEKLILPGVGAFAPAIRRLRQKKLDGLLRRRAHAGVPVLGICLGMQLLFDRSYEDGEWEGLGLIPGRVVRFGKAVKIPHMGWNQVEWDSKGALFENVKQGEFFYFVHSYYCIPAQESDWLAASDYGGRFCAAAARGTVWGVQFHPEKSQRPGLQVLRNFLRL